MCGRLHRVWHERMREMDRAYLVPSLIAAARQRHRPAPVTHDDVIMAFRVFTLQPGQGHWRCACGREAEPDAERHIEALLRGEAEAADDDAGSAGMWVLAATIALWLLAGGYALARWRGVL